MGGMKTLEERFWGKVDKRSPDECWEWTGARNNAGYGNMRVGHSYVNAHRVSYKINIGDIPIRHVVCHKCDNPSCVNPSHLFSGKPSDNDKDKVSKGRQSRGETHPMSKLTEKQIKVILETKGSSYEIAKCYGVSSSLIRMIKRGELWKHIS
jgi:hypothetical protein